MAQARVYLSRRNLVALLSKLDRCKDDPHASQRTLVKNDTQHPKYAQTHDKIIVTAVEDADYYHDRAPGEVHQEDV